MRNLLVAAISLVAMQFSASAQVPAGGPVEIPLRMQAGRLVVPVYTAKGDQLDFMLSTRILATVLSQSTVARVGNEPELQLGGISVPVEGSQTVPDADLTFHGMALHGIIGPSMLNAFHVLIDVPGERLVLKPISASVSWEGVAMSEPVRVRVYHGIVLALDVELNGRPYGATLDIGTPTLLVNEPVKAEAQLANEDEATLQLGRHTFEQVPVLVRDDEVFHRFMPNGGGFVLIGATIARDCAISLSWVHRELRTCVR